MVSVPCPLCWRRHPGTSCQWRLWRLGCCLALGSPFTVSLYQNQSLASFTDTAGRGLAGLDEPQPLGSTLSSSTGMTVARGDASRPIKSWGWTNHPSIFSFPVEALMLLRLLPCDSFGHQVSKLLGRTRRRKHIQSVSSTCHFLRPLIKPAKSILLIYLLKTPITVAGENVLTSHGFLSIIN